MRKQKLTQRFQISQETLKKAKREVITKSNQLIAIIQVITKARLAAIDKNVELCESVLKLKDISIDAEALFKDYENIEFREGNLKLFTEISKKNLSLFYQDEEITENNSELEKFISTAGHRSLRLSRDLGDLKRQIESNSNMFLEGHTGTVRSVAVTKDSKYIISGSDDSTIRIWNILEKRQEAVLEGHTSNVNSVAVTSDNKYIISGSGIPYNEDISDYRIRIWSFSDQRQEALLKGHSNRVNSVAVSSDNKFIISGSDDNTIQI